MSDPNTESQIKDLEKKIAHELTIISHTESIIGKYEKKNSVQQAQVMINESNKRLTFLRKELEKLKGQNNPDSKACKNDLEFSTVRYGLSAEKIATRIGDLEYKIEVEERIKQGSAKMVDSLGDNADRKTKQEAKAKFNQSKDKLQLLKTILNRYQSLKIDDSAVNEDDDKKQNFTKQLVTGMVIAKLGPAKLTSSKSEGFFVIRVDGVEKFRSKVRSKFSFNDEVVFSVEKANEFELSIYDKNESLQALFFFRLHALFEGTQFVDGCEDDYAIEPDGSMKIFFQFSPQVPGLTKRKSKLARRRVIKKKYHYSFGHKFVAKALYASHCAFCCEMIITSGYKCESCEYACHSRCHMKVVNKCIAEKEVELAPDDPRLRLKFKIPHRFEPVVATLPTWCRHCGQVIFLGKKIMRCSECQSSCHTHCVTFIPDFCGIKTELIEQFLMEQAPAPVQPNEEGTYYKKNSKGGVDYSENHSKDSFLKKMLLSAKASASSSMTAIHSMKKTTLDDFHLVSVLGKGNFGKVMLAEEKATKKLYAIKVLKKEFILENDEVESVRSEKRIFIVANKENHPFLVNLHSCFQTDTRIYFVMEYVSGGDLMLHIQRDPFTYDQARIYGAEVLLALEYFHKNNVIYRDLKLDNILLSLEGHIKIADYGLCKENMGPGKYTNTFCGTPEFMAPEILLELDYDRAVDWWAFGVLLYEMILGMAPFTGDEEDEIFESILQREVLYPHVMNRNAVSLIQQLLIKDPRKRLGSSKADAEDIKKHPYFEGIDWDAVLAKKIAPPFKPMVTDPTDVSNFDPEFTSEVPALTPTQSLLHDADQEEFKNFSYCAPNFGLK